MYKPNINICKQTFKYFYSKFLLKFFKTLTERNNMFVINTILKAKKVTIAKVKFYRTNIYCYKHNYMAETIKF